MIDIKVPTVGESISEVTLLKWTKKDGDYVERDEVIAELESEKATFEVNAEKAGVLKLAKYKEGDTMKIGDLLATIDESAAKPEGKSGVGNQEAGVGSRESGVKSGVTETKSNGKPPEVNVQSQPADIKATPVASAIIADKKVDPKRLPPVEPGAKF